ncbi:MAG: alpha/beta fold hydrolase [Pseudomonadota bacterium]|nr:alpha/beta fold hydrolase [Pseudomonadota bacterium]
MSAWPVNHPPLAPGHIDAPHREVGLGDLGLESGEAIVDFRQSFVTHGAPNADRSNAILVCPALTATHHRLDFLIGAGKALDPASWFVIVADPIGNGLSSSPSHSAAQPGMRFPRFALRDMIAAQHRLLTEHLGIDHLHAVVGASMGGMQALQWAVSHPGFMDCIVAMTPMARTAPWAVVVTETARACLQADPAWTGSGFSGRPERGWRAYAGLMSALLMRTPEAVATLGDADAAHRWFDGLVAQQETIGFDAHDYLYQSWAYERHDVGRSPGFDGDTRAALAAITARALLLAPPLDLFNPAAEARSAAAAIRGARFVEIPSAHGHMAATSLAADDAAFLNREIGAFIG